MSISDNYILDELTVQQIVLLEKNLKILIILHYIFYNDSNRFTSHSFELNEIDLIKKILNIKCVIPIINDNDTWL